MNRQGIKNLKNIVSIFTLIALLLTLAFGGYRTGNVEAAGKKSIILNKKSAVLTVGQTITIKVKGVKGLKSKAVIYKSSNSKVASVSKTGKVTAKKAGSATIVVISKQNKKVKAKVLIKVKAKKIKKVFTDRGFKPYSDSPTNQQFFILEDEFADKLREQVFFETSKRLDESHIVARFCANWCTTDEMVDKLAAIVDEVM